MESHGEYKHGGKGADSPAISKDVELKLATMKESLFFFSKMQRNCAN